MAVQSGKKSFHELLRATRENADQTADVMAVLLNMTAEEYEALENWKYPDEDTLKRLCLMMDWNFYDTQRLIINEMISPHRPRPDSELGQGSGHHPGAPRPAGVAAHAPHLEATQARKAASLGERLREVRLVTGQSTDIIALMLNIDEPAYLRLEEGEQPPDEVLRRISMVYNWNYQDLVSVLRSEHARSFQPPRVGMPFLGSTAQTSRLRQLQREMETLFVNADHRDQQSVLAQLELVRDTLRRHHKPA